MTIPTEKGSVIRRIEFLGCWLGTEQMKVGVFVKRIVIVSMLHVSRFALATSTPFFATTFLPSLLSNSVNSLTYMQTRSRLATTSKSEMRTKGGDDHYDGKKRRKKIGEK